MTAHATIVLQGTDLDRLGVAMYDARVLDALLYMLLGTFALWIAYLVKGRLEIGKVGFVLWFPFLLVSTLGAGIVFRHWAEGSAVPLNSMVILFPLAFLLALGSRPIFRMDVGYLAFHALTAAGVIALFAWLLGLVVGPIFQRY